MSEPKWTTGEWRADGFSVASFREIENGAKLTYTEIADMTTGHEPQAEANAHLIAAAPDLYAALDKLLGAQWMCTVDWAPASDMEPIREEARRALAKARGEAA